MKVSLQPIEDLPGDVQSALNDHSLFSSSAFASIWQAKSGRPVCWTAQVDGQTIAALVGVEFGRGPLARFQAMPDGLPAAPWFADSDVDRETALAAILAGIVKHGYAKVFITDFLNNLTSVDKLESAPCETALVKISPDWEPPDKTLRSEIRKAERESVVVTTFHSDQHLDEFLSLLRATEARLEIPSRYPDEYYAALGRVAQQDGRVIWRVVLSESTMVASHVYLLDRPHALYWISAFDRNYSYLKATQFMLWSNGRQFARDGCMDLNLGQSPPDAESLQVFKQKWGSVPYHYRRYQSHSLLGRLK